MAQPEIVVEQEAITKEEVAYWQREVDASLAFQADQFTKRTGYEANIRYYESLQANAVSNIEQMAIVNEYTPAIYSVITSAYNQNPAVNVKAKHPLADQPVRPLNSFLNDPASTNFQPFPLTDLMQGGINYAIENTGFKMENQLALFDMYAAGFACVEVNYRTKAESQFTGKDVPEDDRNMGEKFADDVVDGTKKLLGMNSNDPIEVTEEKVTAQQATLEDERSVDATFVKRWNPMNILFDYRAEVFRESRYIAKIVDMTMAEFKVTYPAFKDSVPSDNLRNISLANHTDKDNVKAVRVYELEIKTLTGTTVLVITPGIVEALDHYTKPIITNGFSIKYATLDKYGKLYPMPRMTMMRKPQDNLNHYTTIEMEHADRQMQKIAVWEGGLTEEGKTALEDNDIYGIVKKKVAGAVFEAVPQGGTTPENKDLQELNKESINKLANTNELAKSGESDSKFATQDALKDKAFQVSTSTLQDALEDLLNDEVEALKDIIMQMWDGQDFFQVTGLVGGDQWYTPEMGALADVLLGDYLVSVNVTSASKPDPLRDRNEAIELAQFIFSNLPMIQALGKVPNIEVINNVIKSYNKNPDALLTDLEPAPIQQQDPNAPVEQTAGQPPGASLVNAGVGGGALPAGGGG